MDFIKFPKIKFIEYLGILHLAKSYSLWLHLQRDLFRMLSKFGIRRPYQTQLNRILYLKIGDIKYMCRVSDLCSLVETYEYKFYALNKFLPTQNDTVFDAGATIGEYALFAAKFAKKVIAIEPDAESFDILKKNIQINNSKNISCLKTAIMDKQQIVKIYRNTGVQGDSISKVGPNYYLSPAFSIDSILKDSKVNIIKLDIEGAEYLALLGAKRTIKRFKPRFIIEVHSQKLKSDVIKFLKKFNYSLVRERPVMEKPFVSLIYLEPN